MLSIISMVVERIGRKYIASFCIGGAAQEQIVFKEMVTEKQSSLLKSEEGKWEVMLIMCKHRFLRGRLKRSPLATFNTRRRAVRGAWCGMSAYDAFLS